MKSLHCLATKNLLPVPAMRYWVTMALLLWMANVLPGQSTFTYSLAGPSTDRFYSACEAGNGDLLLAGTSRSFSGNGTQDIYLVRLRSDGELVWEHFYGGPSDEFGARIVPRQGGGFLIAGSTFSYGAGFDDLYFIAVDDSGRIEWEKTIGDSASQDVSDLIALPDGGFALTGKWLENDSVLGQSFFLRMDGMGNLEALKFYGGKDFDFGLVLAAMPQNRVLLGNQIYLYADSLGLWESRMQLLGLDGSGEILWADTIQHPAPNLAGTGGKAREILMLSDSSYLVLGDMAVRVDSEGNVLSVAENPKADAAVSAGQLDFLTTVDGKLRYHNAAGELLWEEAFEMFADELLATSDGGYLLVGHANLDFFAVKVNCRGTMAADTAICQEGGVPTELSIQFGPNPAFDALYISIDGLASDARVDWELVDLRGRRANAGQGLGNGKYRLPLNGMSAGLYILRLLVAGEPLVRERIAVLR